MLQAQNSPFTPEQVELLNRLLPSLSPEQAVWLSGYLAGIRSGAVTTASSAELSPAGPASTNGQVGTSSEVTVLFGSQTGNAQRLAGEVSRRLTEQGHHVNLSCMSEYKTSDLKKAKHLLVVVSTHGEGQPPDRAIGFHTFLHGRRAPKLEGLRYSVLGLGDIAYAEFCKMGKDFDRRLEELGGQRLYPRVDCDVDYDAPAEAWMQAVLETLAGRPASGEPVSPRPATLPGSRLPIIAAPVSAKRAFGRTNPFLAEVLENINLNGRGSDKETRCLKLSLEGSDLAFEPGDSMGIYPQNHPDLVDAFIERMHWRADEAVPVGQEERPLREALLSHYEVSVLTKPLLEQAAAFSRDGLKDFVLGGREEEVRGYLAGRDLLDLAGDYSLDGTPARDFVRLLRRMPPRLYSISSSHKANPDEVDLTIVAVRYHAHNRDRRGICSGQCAERLEPGDRLPVYVHSNPNFRLPRDPDAAIIMIGPGTGVAPFRAFLEEREEVGAKGKHWLFFGDRRFRTDFLYQTDWLRWRKIGLLTRAHVAFSRDTDQKVYVQHRMRENGRELFAWLQEGAYLYVCGDEKQMAPDVHEALETIVQQEGGMSSEDAKAYLADLQWQRRYQRDVY